MDKQENKRLGPIVLAPGVSHFNAFTFMPALLVLAMGAASAMGASITLVGQEAPVNERGSVIAFNGLFGAIGIGVAVPLGGYLFDKIGPTAPFVMISCMQAVLCILANYRQD